MEPGTGRYGGSEPPAGRPLHLSWGCNPGTQPSFRSTARGGPCGGRGQVGRGTSVIWTAHEVQDAPPPPNTKPGLHFLKMAAGNFLGPVSTLLFPRRFSPRLYDTGQLTAEGGRQKAEGFGLGAATSHLNLDAAVHEALLQLIPGPHRG